MITTDYRDLREAILTVTEARDPKFTYNTKMKAKTGANANVVDRVILTLTAKDSEKFTKLIRRYEQLKRILEDLTKKQVELNAIIKDEADALFDLEDQFQTCVVETCTASITLSKKTPDTPPGTKESVDWKAAYDALLALVPELQEQGKSIIAQMTKVEQVAGKAGSQRKLYSVTPLKEGAEELNEGVLDRMKGWLNSFKKWAMSFREDIRRVNVLIRRI